MFQESFSDEKVSSNTASNRGELCGEQSATYGEQNTEKWIIWWFGNGRGLAALERAEAGTPVLGWGDLRVYLDMSPDGRVVITKTERLLKDDQQDNPPQIVITTAEARKLILDWIAARDKWYAEREAQRAAAGQSK